MEQFKPPISVPGELVKGLYRLADNADEVNWEARRPRDLEYAKSLIPDISYFLDSNIRRVTYNSADLRAIIGVSGVDSAVSAWLGAECMRRAKRQNLVRETDLVTVNFRAMNLEDEEYGKDCYQALVSAYSDLDIHFVWADMTPILREVDEITEEVVKVTGTPQAWPAELATGIIDVTTVSMGYKHWAAALDSTNKTEDVLGEINIPSGCSVKILANLWKSQVYDLGEALGIPESILNKKPINSTYGTSKIDSYFGQIPNDLSPREVFQVLDLTLQYLYEEGRSSEEVSQLLGHSLNFVQKLKTKIDSQDHRRKVPVYQPI